MFRKDADNFTGQKATEHFNYRTALERVILLDDSNRVKAKESLIRFELGSGHLMASNLLDEKSSNPVKKFWTKAKMESIKSDYSMYALNQTIYEKKELHSIVTDDTINDIRQGYQCKENNGELNGSSYQNDNSDENSKSLNDKDETNKFFKNPRKQSENLFKKRLKSEVDDEEDDNTDSEESESEDLESEYIPSDTDGSKPAPKSALLLISSKLKYFTEFYTGMNESKKWLLSSGTCVEDVLFHGGKALLNESLIHSWTIDLSDWETKELFSEEDWYHYQDSGMQVRTTTDLRKVLESTSYRDKNEQYDRESHFDAEWAELVMRNFLMLYEDPDEVLRKEHLEGWFDANIWSVVVDRAFSNVRGPQTVRKEASSKSVAKRKNRKRARKERTKITKIGCKLDGVFRTYDDDIEYGTIEVKSEFVQVNSTDRLKDGLKLGKAMHDMYVCLSHLVKLDEKKVRQLQVIGLQHSGLKLQICQLSTQKGYVSVLKRGELYKIPKKIEKIKDLIMLLSGVWRAKS
ncbi:5700_t:CDS:10 [Acaulospora morrowiae]|uniref:5700_t:CDS:1 n=1 Tax=Acaulospora morrowiae TaxID=94023 RepID=A0A9N8Z126_9GLOM|nr:5700_t:CDS:10 [Acaulospora morrowiae]